MTLIRSETDNWGMSPRPAKGQRQTMDSARIYRTVSVPHGQEVRVADFHSAHPGTEMALRWSGHNTDIYVVSSATGDIVNKLQTNFSPTNVGMEAVYWNGPDGPALLYNVGWLWDLETGAGAPLPAERDP